MRTTLTIDDQIAQALKQHALRGGKSFKQVVNETLRLGLRFKTSPPSKDYRLKPSLMGRPKAGVNLIKALQTADAMQQKEDIRELEMRK